MFEGGISVFDLIFSLRIKIPTYSRYIILLFFLNLENLSSFFTDTTITITNKQAKNADIPPHAASL